MFCKNCGSEIPEGIAFCPQCGYRVGTKSQSDTNTDTAAYRDIQSQQPVCPICGNPVKPSASFCKTCGSRLNSADNQTDVNDIYTPPYNDYDNYEPAAPKKKSKMPLIIGGAAAAVLIIGGVCIACASSISGFFKRTFISPEKYYTYVELKALKDNTEMLGDLYDTYLDNIENRSEGSSVNLTLTLEDGGRSLLGTVVPMDLSWLKEVSMKMEGRADDSSLGSEAEFYLNEKKLASLHVAADMDLQEIYMKIPELSADYLGIDLASVYEDSGTEFSTGMEFSELFTQLPDYCSDGETLENLINRYGEIIFDNIAEVEKDKDTLTVNGVSQKCTTLEATIKPSELSKMGQEIITELKNDKDIEKMIRAFADDAQTMDPYGDIPDADTLYQEFTSSLDDAMSQLTALEDEAENSYIISKIWIGKSDQIVGRNFTCVSYDNVEQLLHYARPEHGKEFALEANVFVNDSTVNITGNGTISGDKENSTYTFAQDGISMLAVEVEDYDIDEMKEGYLNGAFTFRPLAGIANAVDADEMGGILVNYALKTSFESSENNSNTEWTLLSADLPMFTMSLESEQESKNSTDFPGDSDTVYNMVEDEDLIQYASSADWDGFLNILKESDIPAEYMEMIESGIRELQDSLEMYNLYY